MEFGLCLEMVFLNETLENRLRKASAIGFRYAEFWFVDQTYKGSPETLAEKAAECGVKITNTVIGSPDGSVGGGLTDPGRRSAWLQRARMTLDFNARAGIPATIVCTGNVAGGLSDRQMMQSVQDGLAATAEMAEKYGVDLLLEPLNDRYDHPGYWLTSSDLGADLCRKTGSKRVKLLFDCYHMQIMEGDLVNHITWNNDVIGHFHSAGVPGRHEIYQGETDYPFLLNAIKKLGYEGVFALEYQPCGDDEKSVTASLAHLRQRSC